MDVRFLLNQKMSYAHFNQANQRKQVNQIYMGNTLEPFIFEEPYPGGGKLVPCCHDFFSRFPSDRLLPSTEATFDASDYTSLSCDEFHVIRGNVVGGCVAHSPSIHQDIQHLSCKSDKFIKFDTGHHKPWVRSSFPVIVC